jgi:hypothetical protein
MARSAVASRRCPICGVANAAYATFCIECGEPLDAGAPRSPESHAVPAVARQEAGWSRQFARRGELWLGALLIVAVLGVAVLDWRHQDEQAAGYHAGDIAAAAHHWTAAQAAFARLGDYRDAPGRAIQAAAQMQRRDASYALGTAALSDQAYLSAFSAFSQTLAIEPDYRDAPALFAGAGRAIIQAALANTVYRRVSGPTPGLYTRRAGGGDWLLPGSDALSRVWTATARGQVVYDGPIGPTLGANPRLPPAGDDATPWLAAGRQLWLTEIGTAATPRPLSRTFGLGGGMVVGQDGVWWFDPAEFHADATHGYSVRGVVVRLLAFYDLQSLRASEAVLADDTYFLLDMDAGTGQLLIGHYSWSETPQPRTQLYLAGPTGHALQPLADVAGVVNTARFSPDGQAVLYSAQILTSVFADAHLELVAVALSNPQHPAQLLARMVAWGPGLDEGSLRGVFVPGPGHPRVLIRRQAADLIRLSIRDLKTDVEANLADDVPLLSSTWFPDDGQNTLLWGQAAGNTPALIIQPLDPRQPAIHLAPFPPMLSTRPTFVQVALSGDNIFYTVTERRPDAPDQGSAPLEPTSVYGAAVTTRAAPAVQLCRQPAQSDGNLRIVPLGAVVACVDPGNSVRLRSADGAVTLTALDGVDAIWPLSRAMRFWQP